MAIAAAVLAPASVLAQAPAQPNQTPAKPNPQWCLQGQQDENDAAANVADAQSQYAKQEAVVQDAWFDYLRRSKIPAIPNWIHPTPAEQAEALWHEQQVYENIAAQQLHAAVAAEQKVADQYKGCTLTNPQIPQQNPPS